MKHATIFIVEDDLVSAHYLKEVLEAEGYIVTGIADNGEDAIERLKQKCVDIVLMDIILKGSTSGSETAILLKREYPACKIIFLTAYADEEMIENAVNAKAVAYLIKPYREKEILATIKLALQQKNRRDVSDKSIRLKNNFVYNTEKNRLEKNGREVPLSPKKQKLITLLAKNKNHVVSNEQLSLQIWGDNENSGRLRSLISRFKKKIGSDIITNANGLGYMVTSY